MVEKGHECNGAERFVGYKKTISECAFVCGRSANMFVFGTNEFGVRRCNRKGCACYCEDATQASCEKRIVHTGYNLYRLGGNGN